MTTSPKISPVATVTAEQRALAEAIGAVLAEDPAIGAAWLGGSLGRGAGDEFSDVDVVALVTGGSAAATGLRYASDLGGIAEPVLINPLFGGRVVSVVTDDWRRFDITFVEPGDLARFDAAHLRTLFNRGDWAPPRREPTPYRATPEAVRSRVEEFLRIAGLSVVAVGRGEFVLALSGFDIQRRLTVELMLEANGIGPADRGGALKRNPFLTPEQRRALEGLSPLRADRESVLRGTSELAAVFLPLARRLTEATGASWPSALESATRRHLESRLGLVLP